MATTGRGIRSFFGSDPELLEPKANISQGLAWFPLTAGLYVPIISATYVESAG
jgi:hypothetical protein